MSDVLLEVSDGVGEVVLNRPERKNAITGPLGLKLAECMAEASHREDVRVVILRGAEGAFCSGLDLGEFNADPGPERRFCNYLFITLQMLRSRRCHSTKCRTGGLYLV